MADLPAVLDKETIFCREYARSGDALEALTIAGIENEGAIQYSRKTLADMLLARDDIQAAIKALRAIEQTTVDIETTHRSISQDMDVVFGAAMKKEDFKAAIAAKRLQADVLGLLEQRIHITSHKTIDQMSTEELRRIAARGMIDVTPTRVSDAATDADNAPASGN